MKSLLALAVAVTSTQVYAGSLNLDFRLDSRSSTYNDAAEAPPAPTASAGVDNHRFHMQTGRVDYKGNLSESTAFRLRLRFNESQTAVNARDNLNKTVDYAFINHKMSDNLSLTVGKYASDVGGNEGATAGGDIYYFSESYSGAGYLSGSAAGHTDIVYLTGAKLGYTMSGHNLNLMAANLDRDVTSGGKIAQTRLLTGASYFGKFMDNAFNVIASYHMENYNPAADYKNNYAGLGLAYTMDAWNFQADYLVDTYETPAAATTKSTVSSAIGKVTYAIDPTMSVQVKGSASEDKRDAATTSLTDKYTGVAAAFEWKPKAEENFRYHVAYVDRTMKPGVAAGAPAVDDRKLQEVIVGARFVGDFMK